MVLSGGGEKSQRRAVLRHLLGGCPICQEAARRLTGSHFGPAGERELPRLSDMLARLESLRADREAEQERAQALMGDFLRHPSARQWTLLRNSSRFDTWAFAEQLSATAFEAI
ncbi:MAG: hypothetical protein K8H90_01205, partial [Thermoanaerobaculia bacterium]|nr:hypothetical protein [Thermoanaerobaculia bacterium]